MAKKKKIKNLVKLQIPAGQASPAPPVGPVLGQNGISIPQFVQEFNSRTSDIKPGLVTPVEITVYADNSYEFITKTPPVANLIKDELNLELASGEPESVKVGSLTLDQVRSIAEIKMPDVNADTVEACMEMVKGTARSMGVTIEGEEE